MLAVIRPFISNIQHVVKPSKYYWIQMMKFSHFTKY